MKAVNMVSAISILLSLGMLSQHAVANPAGAQVVNGQVTFSQPDISTLHINNSDGAIINWQSFSVNAGEITHFQQSGANSAVLNQVTGNNASNIFGSLTSNGQVYLINQHGIVFGESAVVNTAGFIASTLNLSNQDFLQGKLNFSAVNAAGILNQGYITAGANGDIALIAPNIINEGVIRVEQGDVILAAGEKVTLSSFSASEIGFEIQSENNTVTNLGSVLTEGGAVGMFAGSLHHSGDISANALATDESGNIVLVAKNNLTVTDNAVISADGASGGTVVIQSETAMTLVSGSVTATGNNGSGGVIDVLGKQVAVINNASIDASGSEAGGQVHIGGNYQGNGGLQNAVATFVAKDTVISANAIEAGNGGEIIVWADDATRVHGSISAHGGLLSGDGGFVETSGKQFLDVSGIELNLAAVNGNNGEWLLDPVDITISSAIDSGTVLTNFPDFSSSTASNINILTLDNALNSASVTIATSGGAGGAGDITLDTVLSFNLGNTSVLTLNADNNIVISGNGSVAVSGASDLTLNFNAKNDIAVQGTLLATDSSTLTMNFVADSDATNVGAIDMTGLVNTNGGNVSLTAATAIVFSQDADISTGLGSLGIVTTAGDVLLQSTASLAADLISSKPLSITAAGVLVLENNGTAATINSNNNNISVVANDVQLFGTINSGTGALSISSGAGLGMDLGEQIAAGFGLDNAEFAKLTSAHLVLGQPAIADVFINSPLTVSGDLTINAGNINFNQPISTTGISATGNVLLNAQASIVDNAGIDLDIVASNISLHAQSGIGNTNPLEIQLANATGILDFSNSAGSVDIINTAVSASDVMQVFGTNLGAGDALTIGNDFGVTDIIASGVTSNQGLLEIVTDTLNVNALLDNNNSSMPMKLLVNDLEITADLFSTTGGVKIGTLSDGTGITFAGGVTTGLDLTQSEIDFINAPSIDFGIKDMPLAGMGTGDIIFAAGINFGASDVSFLTMADLRFLQGALTAITTSGNVFIDTAGSVIGQSIDVTDISATNLDFITALDFGNTLSNAIELDVALLAGSTPGGEIYIDSPAALLVGFINSASGLPVWMQANGDITLATLTTSGSNISLNTSALTNGVGGAILHDGVAANNINGANDLNLLSETGVGSLQNAIEITNVTGNISADVMSVGNIYLDNVGAASGSLLLDSMTTLAGDVLIRNLNTAQSTNIMTQLLATGNITVESNSDINVNNNVIASGGSVVGLRVVGGTGDVNINSLLQADNGSVAVLTNSGGISFGTGGYISSNAGVVSLNASGSISDGGALGAHLRGADSVMLNAALGIGTLAAPITVEDIGVGGLTLSSTLSNGIYVNNVAASLISDFVINSVTAANGEVFINNLNAAQGTKISGSSLLSGGNFSVSSIASMFIDGSITDSSAGIIDLQVNGAGGSLFINSGSIQSSTGTISLLAANDIQLSGATILQTAQPGLISLTANNGQVFSDPAVSITGGASLAVLANTGIILNGSNDVGAVSFSTAAGDIDFSGSNDILLDVISASTTSSVTLTAAGSIIDANGATDNITAQTISLNAANGIGTLTDPIETAAAVSLLFNNAANDVFINDSNAVLLLPSVSGGNANISFVNNMQLNTVVAAGNLSLISQAGYIQDSNDSGLVTLNLTAASIDLSASTGIGLGNPIETQLTASTGVINAVNSSSGSVEIENWAINSTDVATFTANNLALGGSVFLLNPFGVMQAGNISANQGAIELKALDLNISGTVNNNDLATGNGVLLVADELLISGGSVNANNGDVEIFTLTDGRAITLGAADLSGNSLALLQSDMDAITSARLSIGLMDSVNSLGSGDITIAGVLDVGAKDIRLQTLANINFNNGTVSGLSTSGLMELNAGLAIIGDNSSGINLTAAGLSLEASHGIGSVDAIRTQVSDLTVFNQFSNNINVSNSGALTVNDSANLGGAMSLSSDNSLTLTPFAGLAGTTGAIAQTDLTLKAANSLLINGVTSAANINLLSDNGIIINEVVTATAGLVMNADADANAAGDLLIENINAAVLAVNAADISVNAAAVNLLASSGAVHVSSEAGLNLLARTNVNIAGGDGAGFDAYLSASGNINMDITGNLLLNGGTGSNTAASIFDVSASHSNTLNMAVAGNVTLNGGPGVSSGAYISAGEVNMLVGGDMTLSGSPANFSPAQVRGFGLDMSLHVAGNLSFSDGTGSASLAQVISNDGLGYLQLSYLSCSGCATGLLYLDQPIPNAATNEIVSAQNTSVISTGPVVSSSDALLAFLEESLAGADSNQQAGTILTTTAEDEAGAQDKEPQAKVLVCR